MDVKDILENLGFSPVECQDGFRMTRIYDNGDNPTSLSVSKEGKWYDFVECIGGNDLSSLIKKVLNLESEDKAKEYLEKNNYNYTCSNQEIKEPLIKGQKTFNPDIILELQPKYDYWINRGISKTVLEQNLGGVQGNRYWFLIKNSKNQIVGKTGRDITGKSKISWIHKGQKNLWVYNAWLNNKIIVNKKEVIIVESIGDYLSLAECGINNVIVIFGVSMSLAVLNYLLKINPNRIIISLNDDSNKNNVGNDAAIKLYRRLTKYFDRCQLETKLPKGEKDWNLLLTNHGKNSILEQLL